MCDNCERIYQRGAVLSDGLLNDQMNTSIFLSTLVVVFEAERTILPIAGR